MSSKEVPIEGRNKEVLELYEKQLQDARQQYEQAVAPITAALQLLCYVLLEEYPEGARVDVDRRVIVLPDPQDEAVEQVEGS